MSPKKKIITDIRNTVNDSTIPLLGFQIWWEILATEKTFAEMAAIMKGNIGEEHIPSEPSKRRALRTALQEAEQDGLITKIREDNGVIAYALHEQVVDKKAIDVTLEKRNVIVFDSSSGKLDIRKSHKKAEIVALFERYQSVYTDVDVRRILKAHIERNGGILMRKHGGIYFLRSREAKDAAAQFLANLGCTLLDLPIPDIAQAKKTMSGLVRDQLQRDVELAAEEVKRIAGEDSVRPDVLRSRVEEFKTLKAQVETYRDLLQADAESMGTKIAELSEEILAVLSGEMAAYPQAKLFPHGSAVLYKGKALERHGAAGKVVGYFNHKCGTNYVKVLFEKSKIIAFCGPSQLTLA